MTEATRSDPTPLPDAQVDIKPWLGLIGALCCTGIWSGFILVSRMATFSELTIYDVAGLRFALAGALVLPFAWKYWPRNLKLWQVLFLASGPGVPYALLNYGGLEFAPAAYAGVFVNGMLPIASAIVAALWLKEMPGMVKTIGLLIVLAGCAAMAFSGGEATGPDVWIGELLFIASAGILGSYMVALRVWQLSWQNLIVLVPVTNLVLFVPLWLLFLPSNVATAPMDEILLQALYQGLGPSLIAIITFTLAVRHLGAVPTAALMALVPAIVAIAAIPLLNEMPLPMEWVGIAAVVVGILATLKSTGENRK